MIKPSKESLEEDYISSKMSIRAMSAKYGCGPTSIRKFMLEYSIERRRNNQHYNDLSNRDFGKLHVLPQQPRSVKNRKVWLCECKCGNRVEVQSNHLVVGNTTSCGCNKFSTGEDSPTWKGYGELTGHHWYQVKHGAELRNLEFSITIEHAWSIFLKQNRKCALTGVELYFSNRRVDAPKNEYEPSLDRIDNNLGYVEGNLQWIRKRLNIMRGPLSIEEFVQLCKDVAKYN